jgi:hypothetical protein
VAKISYLGIEKFKRMTNEELEALFRKNEKEVSNELAAKKEKLLTLDIETINHPNFGMQLYCGISEDGREYYVWADDVEQAEKYLISYGDLVILDVDENGEIDLTPF